jgi:hypothetical protein
VAAGRAGSLEFTKNHVRRGLYFFQLWETLWGSCGLVMLPQRIRTVERCVRGNGPSSPRRDGPLAALLFSRKRVSPPHRLTFKIASEPGLHWERIATADPVEYYSADGEAFVMGSLLSLPAFKAGLRANYSMEDESLLFEIWQEGLRPWFLHLVIDLVKTLSILTVLYICWEAIALLRFRGYPDDLCKNLEKTHFVFMWTALSITSANFVLKQVVSLWKTKR